MYGALSTAQSDAAVGDNDGADGFGRAVVQEYLVGEEWIVDTVSRNGQHKIVALWRYDKGEANGAPFVYFGVEAMASDGCEALCEYAVHVLAALEWSWGPCHLEIMLTDDGACVRISPSRISIHEPWRVCPCEPSHCSPRHDGRGCAYPLIIAHSRPSPPTHRPSACGGKLRPLERDPDKTRGGPLLRTQRV